MLFGPKFLSNKLYQQSSTEDLELAKTLLRPGSLFIEDLIQQKNLFSKQGYGSVPRAFVVCKDDLGIPLKFQHWMIQNAGINDVLEIKGADHMAMLCKPQQLYDSLNQISTKYT
ncbi:polyneuridine-aldehyde esterase [Trifolium pratense]|nr:polyneuridine-aldehyde esterase [Trifolium pratense]